MRIRECKVCGNTEKGAEILRCDKCNQIVGCHKPAIFGSSGCISYDQRTKACPNCGYNGGWLRWYTVLATIE